MPDPEVIELSKEELRAKFNRQILPHIRSGKYRTSEHPRRDPQEPMRSKLPTGTKSVNLNVFDDLNRFVAQVHVYVDPNGVYQFSGELDPISLKLGGIFYRRKPEHAYRAG